MRGLSQYDVPLRLQPNPESVLIVGAGTGNDVAGALRGGAKHVTAVEIDPAIIDIGRRHHPERPYDSPRVTVVNDDARSFFATTDKKFDLIIFGLLDSHTTTSMMNARLDHYVYTRESIARVSTLLTDEGVICMNFWSTQPFISDRMAGCIKNVFENEPLVFNVPWTASGWGGVMFVTGNQAVINDRLVADTQLASRINEWQQAKPIELNYSTKIATDDWPYIYLESPRIPSLFYLLGGLMIGLFCYGRMRLGIKKVDWAWGRSSWHFFFMGAAFLLLEVQNISKASVVLGNTWVVNAVIISGILFMILLANLVSSRWPRISIRLVAALLILSCVALYFVDLSRFAFLPYALKAPAVGLLTTLPMFFAGIIFIRSFSTVQRKDRALGANLLGSLCGGLLQSLTFVIGVKALLLVVAAMYIVAIVTFPTGQNQRRRSDHEIDDEDCDAVIEMDDEPAVASEEFAEPVGV
jgi:spermidine synthase